MKVRKFLFAGALIVASLFSVNSVMAESTPSETDQVTVNIKLNPIQTITVNHESVLIEYITKDDYNDGVSKKMDNHLTVFSTGGFEVQVKANSNFIRSEETDYIPASDVIIRPTALDGYTVSETNLEVNSYKPIITSENGGRDISFGITYDNTQGGGDKYIDKYDDKDVTKDNTFTAKVEYLIVAA